MSKNHSSSLWGSLPSLLTKQAIAWSIFLSSESLYAQIKLNRTPVVAISSSLEKSSPVTFQPMTLPSLGNAYETKAVVYLDPAVLTAPLPSPVPQEIVPLPQGQQPTGMVLQDFENLALRNNPSLAEFAARANALRGKWTQVGLAPNPYAGYSSQQTGSGNTVEQRGVVFGQEFVTADKLGLNRAVVSQEVQRAEQDYAAQNMRVLSDVRITFYDVLASQQRNRLAKEIAETTSNAFALTERRLAAKEVGRPDVLQARIENEAAQVLQQRTENQYLEAWRKLSAIIGMPAMQPQPLQGNLDEQIPRYEWDATLQRLLAASPEIAAAHAEIQRARWAYQRAQAEKHPNVSFQGIVQDDRSIDAVNGAVQVTLPIPLWNKNQGGIAQTGHEAIAAERALQRMELDLQQRLATVFQRYDSARVQVERYSTSILPNSRENLDLVRTAYQAGEYGFLEMLLAQRTFSQTNLAYIDSLQEMRTVAIEIEGMLLTNSLQAK